MKTTSFFVLIVLSVNAAVAQRPYENNYPDDRNSNRGYNSPSDNYPNRNNTPNDNYSNRGYNLPNGNYPNRGYNSPNGNYSNLNNLRIEDLQRAIYFKINRGIESGALNQREAQRLGYALSEIDQKSRYFRADGFLSIQEENELRYDLLRLNDQVFYEKHDGDYGYGRGNNPNERHNWHERNRRSW